MKWLALLLLAVSFAHADELSHRRVERYFRQVAEEVTPASYGQVLETAVIEVSDEELVDNGGSLVDAIGVPGKVTLSHGRWLSFIREDRDVRLLVLHEVLRMAGVNDDDYRVSRQHLPVLDDKIELRPYCDLRVARTKTEERFKKVNGQGYGAPLAGGVMVFNGRSHSTAEAQAAAVEDLKEQCVRKGYPDGHTVLGGSIEIVRENTNGFSETRTRAIIEGQCRRLVSVKRSRDEQREEGCLKVRRCQEFIAEGVIAALYPEDQAELAAARRTWRCN